MTISDVLDGSFAVIKREPKAVLGAVAVFVIPFQVLAVLLQRDAVQGNGVVSYFASSVAAADASSGVTILGVIGAALALSVMRFYVGGVVSVFVAGWYAGKRPTAREAVVGSLKRTAPFLAVWALVLPIKAISLVFCFVGVIVAATFFALAAPVIVIERAGPLIAIRRSASLVASRFWASLGVISLSVLVETIVQIALSMLPTAFAPLFPAPFDWILLAAGQAAGALIATTALVGATVLLYIDLRVRKEGLDLELRASEALVAAVPKGGDGEQRGGLS